MKDYQKTARVTPDVLGLAVPVCSRSPGCSAVGVSIVARRVFARVTRGDHHSSSCQDMCKDDACHAIEGVSFTKAANALRALPPPVSSLYLCLLNLLPPPVLVDQFAASTAGDPPEIQALDHTWQFARRAAPLSRAPALNA